MRIKTLEQRSGFTRDTVRFYERNGLISTPRRQANSYRNYDEHTLAELRFIQAARELGFSLNEIKVAIPSLRETPRRCEALLQGLHARRRAIRDEITQRQHQLQRLDALITRFEGIAAD